ncbi:DNA polymerase Y family protein [Actinacidiphila yeochonensis]|uniref:DNA polymerase Y family protein n=1 Tax=Actinacidiphila yeochonensis TaxID=89050 RepID=UPI00056B947F|nr:ImpB/MucB/SamB family protein [Actinacidiphila yeochonensis]
MRTHHIAHLRLLADLGAERYQQVLELLNGIIPHVQAFPPDAVQLDLTPALRYFDRSPYELVQMARMRVAALYGIETSAGLARNPMLAAMAAAASPPGRTTRVPGGQEAVEAWLGPLPVSALPGVGRATAATLGTYGLHTIGQVASTPAVTLQRILGAATARQLAERVRGHDPRPVTPQAPTARMTADLVLDRDCLDPVRHHRAVLGLAEELGRRLRTGTQVTGRLTLTVRYADQSATTRTRTLPEPTAHSPLLAAPALGVLTSLALQRARVRGYALTADRLLPAADATHQLSFDPADARARAVEAAADRARNRFGPGAVSPATLADPGRG